MRRRARATSLELKLSPALTYSPEISTPDLRKTSGPVYARATFKLWKISENTCEKALRNYTRPRGKLLSRQATRRKKVAQVADVKPHGRITMEVTLVLNEREARALNALTSYGFDDFLNALYTKLGRTYIEPYQDGLASLFTRCRETITPTIKDIEDAREHLGRRIRDRAERASAECIPK